MKSVYESVHNKDYDHEVDRKVAKALLPLYAEMVEADALPSFYQTIQTISKETMMHISTIYMIIPSSPMKRISINSSASPM